MVGARRAGSSLFYPRSDLALRHGVGVEGETTSAAQAQAGLAEWRYERPENWEHLPWA